MINYLGTIVLFLGIVLGSYSQEVEDTLCFKRSVIEIKQAKYDQQKAIIQRRDSVISWQIDELNNRQSVIKILDNDKKELNIHIKAFKEQIDKDNRTIKRLKSICYTLLGGFAGVTIIAILK